MKLLHHFFFLVFIIFFHCRKIHGAIWPKVLLLGDGFVELGFSYKSPWCSMLSNHLVRVADVVNRGVYNYNTRSYVDILDKALAGINPEDVAVVVFFIGTIDSFHSSEPDKHIPLLEYKSNLRRLIRLVQQRSVSTNQMLVITGVPVVTANEKARNATNVLTYAEATRAIASELQVSWLPLHEKMVKDFPAQKDVDAHFDQTGMFNYKGASYFFRYIWPHVQKKLKSFLDTPILTKKFPMWSPSPG